MKIKIKRGTAAAIAAANPTLAAGELCIETDTKRVKCGDGTTAYNALGYASEPMLNSRDIITASGNYTAPVTGWYKVTAKGGGGGGASGLGSATHPSFGGGGGSEGAIYTNFFKLTAGTIIPCIVGAGGSGGAKPSALDTVNNGNDGGSSTFTIAGTEYVASHGNGASRGAGPKGGLTDPTDMAHNIQGMPGGTAAAVPSDTSYGAYGGTGGGHGGASGRIITSEGYARDNTGAGGGGGTGYKTLEYTTKGSDGGSGFVMFEYFDPSK